MNRQHGLRLGFVALLLGSLGVLKAAESESKVSSSTDPDYKIQGEYKGKVAHDNQEISLGVQVIALGSGKFHAVAYGGGLPGDGWDGFTKFEADGEMKEGKAVFGGDDTHGEIKDGRLRILSATGEELAAIERVERQSPTLGAKPPAGAIVLFDGRSPSEFEGGKMTDDGLLIAGATSKRTFQNCQLHVEFQLPFMPSARGQGRGNSGCYLQGRYEVQMLDSFGLKGENNECGGIYSIKSPDVNMCLPPLTWQTYDVHYTAAKFADGKKAKNATMSVKHNGVAIHKEVELPRITTAARQEGPEPGPIYLQDHGNPVRYRNIWIVEM